MAIPVAVMPGASSALAIPKSITTGPSGPISTLAGLKSRCRIPARWIATRAVAVLTASRSSAAPRRGPSRSTSWRRDGPGTYSLTMYGWLPSRSAWRTGAVQNRATRWATATSRRKRVRASASAASPWWRSLTATCSPPGPRPR